MSGENRVDKFEKFIRSLTALLTFALVVVGLWYTWETRNLRKQAEAQLSEIRKQFQLSNVPSLFPSVIHKDTVKELIMEEKIKQTTGKIRYSKEELAEVLKYYVVLENVADKIAYDVRLYVFDSDTKSYLKSAQSKAFIRAKDEESITLFEEKDNFIDEEQLTKEVTEVYGLNLFSIKKYIESKKFSILLLFFKDIQGNAYLRTRTFVYDEQNNRLQGRTILHELK